MTDIVQQLQQQNVSIQAPAPQAQTMQAPSVVTALQSQLQTQTVNFNESKPIAPQRVITNSQLKSISTNTVEKSVNSLSKADQTPQPKP